MTKKQDDALIGRRVRINDDATIKPGLQGTIVHARRGGEYEVDFGGEGSTFWFPMEEFTVLPEDMAALPAGQLLEADPYLVAPSLNNPRRRRGLDIDSLNSLAASIKAQGLAQPILVRPLPGARTPDTFADREDGRPLPVYELVCGERRLRASRIAGLPTMPMLLRELSDEQALELQLVENIEREDLDPMEEAEGFELLRDKLGYSVEQIAERIGRGRGESYVYKTLKLTALVPEAREAMHAGVLGRSTGLLVARYPAALQAEVVNYIATQATNGEPAPFRTVAPAVFKRFNLGLKDAVFDTAAADLVPAAGACTTCPKRSGAQADIFGDAAGSPDSCTDPDCYGAKREAHIVLVKRQAQKDGFKVIDEDEARRAIATPHQQHIQGYVRLTDTAYTVAGNDGVEREVTFEDALRAKGKGAPKPRILIHPHTGKAEKVISADMADKLVPKDTGTQTSRQQREAAAASLAGGAEPEDPDSPEVVLRDPHVERAVLLRIFDAIRTGERTATEALLVTRCLFALADHGELLTSGTERYLGWEADLQDQDNDVALRMIHERLAAMPAEQIAQVLVMAAVEITCNLFGTTANEVEAIAQSYGVDILAVRDKVSEDLARNATGPLEEADEEEAAEASA